MKVTLGIFFLLFFWKLFPTVEKARSQEHAGVILPVCFLSQGILPAPVTPANGTIRAASCCYLGLPHIHNLALARMPWYVIFKGKRQSVTSGFAIQESSNWKNNASWDCSVQATVYTMLLIRTGYTERHIQGTHNSSRAIPRAGKNWKNTAREGLSATWLQLSL